MTCYASVNTSFGIWQIENISLFWLSLSINLITMLIIFCSPTTAKSVPINYLILFIFTLTESYIVSASIAFVDANIILMAASLTTLMTCSLAVFACITKRDFTIYGSILFTLSTAILLFFIFSIIYPSQILELLICCSFLVIYSFYLIYDIQMIAGGKHFSLSMDDYIIGAIIIYLDIIILFLRLIQLLSILKKK